MKAMKEKPPRLADRFLEWYCNPELLDEVHGDLHELFRRRVTKYGVKKSASALLVQYTSIF